MAAISTKILYDNENYSKQVITKYSDKVVTKTYRKYLGGTQWMFVKSNPPKNYNGCYMLTCEETTPRPEYESNRIKYCSQIKDKVNFKNAIKDQSSMPIWARR
jgi:hypothetical protein